MRLSFSSPQNSFLLHISPSCSPAGQCVPISVSIADQQVTSSSFFLPTISLAPLLSHPIHASHGQPGHARPSNLTTFSLILLRLDDEVRRGEDDAGLSVRREVEFGKRMERKKAREAAATRSMSPTIRGCRWSSRGRASSPPPPSMSSSLLLICLGPATAPSPPYPPSSSSTRPHSSMAAPHPLLLVLLPPSPPSIGPCACAKDLIPTSSSFLLHRVQVKIFFVVAWDI